ncbi:UNVERIFIED_CONTAM: hypothetical protein Slati_3534700 [Sesamum latifolium]|uniref:Uncharacterized protein n=1 Tax=Sesamum latifolium TaxID=2727402 RepID=A0AAW2UIP8_9LAMI
MSVAVILNLTYFLSKNVDDRRTKSVPQLVVGEMESRNVKNMESVDVRNVQFNSRQEDENLHKKIEVVEGMEFRNVKNVKSVDVPTLQFNRQEDGNLHKKMEVVEGMESCRNVKNVKELDGQIVEHKSDQEKENLQMIIEQVGSIVKKLKKIKDGKVADDQRTTRNLSSSGSSSQAIILLAVGRMLWWALRGIWQRLKLD